MPLIVASSACASPSVQLRIGTSAGTISVVVTSRAAGRGCAGAVGWASIWGVRAAGACVELWPWARVRSGWPARPSMRAGSRWAAGAARLVAGRGYRSAPKAWTAPSAPSPEAPAPRRQPQGRALADGLRMSPLGCCLPAMVVVSLSVMCRAIGGCLRSCMSYAVCPFQVPPSSIAPCRTAELGHGPFVHRASR
jgi:hypothetical protein